MNKSCIILGTIIFGVVDICSANCNSCSKYCKCCECCKCCISKEEVFFRNQSKVKKGDGNGNTPKGLINLGLSCYMNSLTQCLFYTKDLREYFINNQNKFTNDQPVCKAFAGVMDKLKNSKSDNVDIREFKNIMGNKNGLFEGVKAGDAKDLYFNLIDSLLSETGNNDNNGNNEQLEGGQIAHGNREEMFKETLKEIDEKNIINKTFIGYYEIIYNCSKKDAATYSFATESFLLFELGKIKSYCDTSKLSIGHCFKYYHREQLNTEFYCSECKAVHKGTACERIYRPPKIMVIILDRGHGKIFEGPVKIYKYLDLRQIITEPEYKYSSLYRLICISTHKGTSSVSGHYVANCLTDNGKYHYFSDNYVEEIDDEGRLFNDEPYLLFYERVDDSNTIDTIKDEHKKEILKIESPEKNQVPNFGFK